MSNTESTPNRTSAARAVLKEKLGGLSPVAAGRLREKKALEWIYKFGWASATTLEHLVGTQRSGLALRLIKNKLVSSTELDGIASKYVPSAYLTLTKLGFEQIEDQLELGLEYSLHERPNLMNIKHDEIAQRRTAIALQKGQIVDYVTERQMASKFQQYVKKCDVLWIFKDGTKAAIEIERTQKHGRDLDQFVRSTLISLNNKDNPYQPDFMYLLTTKKVIKEAYEAAFAPGQKYNKWYKDKEINRWVKEEKQGVVPAELSAKVMFELIEK